MPLYEFKCEDHETIEEHLLSWAEYDKFKANELKFCCKECGKEMKRVIGAAAVKWNCSGSHASEYNKYGRK